MSSETLRRTRLGEVEKIARLLQTLCEHLISLGQDIRLILDEEPRQEQLDPGRDPQDTCEVGDPDPIRPVDAYCRTGHWPGEPGVGLAYACSREARHGGLQHVATDGETVLAVWPR